MGRYCGNDCTAFPAFPVADTAAAALLVPIRTRKLPDQPPVGLIASGGPPRHYSLDLLLSRRFQRLLSISVKFMAGIAPGIMMGAALVSPVVAGRR